MAKRILAANWKMNLLLSEAEELTRSIVEVAKDARFTGIYLAAPTPYLLALQPIAKGSLVKVGAQTAHQEISGAFTGEVSVSMLREVGARFALAGHSERRHLFHETNTESAERAIGILLQGMPVIFCIGETLEQRRNGSTLAVLKEQLRPFCSKLSKDIKAEIILAYEPVWAIGTGIAATPTDIAEAHLALTQLWKELLPLPCPPILYGGSVAPQNYREILKTPHVSGALVGKASLKAESFLELLKISEEIQ